MKEALSLVVGDAFNFESLSQVDVPQVKAFLQEMSVIEWQNLAPHEVKLLTTLASAYERQFVSDTQPDTQSVVLQQLGTLGQKVPAQWRNLAATLQELADLTTPSTYLQNLTLLIYLQLYINKSEDVQFQQMYLTACLTCVKDQRLREVTQEFATRLCDQVFMHESEQPTELHSAQMDILTQALVQIYHEKKDHTRLQFFDQLFDALNRTPEDEHRSEKALKVIAMLYQHMSEPNRRTSRKNQEAFIETLNRLFADNIVQWQVVGQLIADAEYLVRLNDKAGLSKEDIQEGTAISIETLKLHKQQHPQWALIIDAVLADAAKIAAAGERAELFDTLDKTALYLNDPTNPARQYAFHQARKRASGKASPVWRGLGASLFILGVAVLMATSVALFAPAVIWASTTLLAGLKAGILGHIAALGSTATTSSLAGIGFLFKGREQGMSKDLHQLEDTVRSVVVRG